jgi:predicted dithiol-disulfide oxidoreductase (DUF899 family)
MNFPNETSAYRAARDRLLQSELDLRRQIESVAAQRRELPQGGEVPEDYVFDGVDGKVRLSQLFGKGDTLLAYSFMYGPKMDRPCPMCTSIIDGLQGNAVHITQRADLVIIAKSPLERILAFARGRGWKGLRFLSSAGNSYNRDYHGEDAEGGQWPMMNVFRKTDRIRHTWGSELLDAPEDPGQNAPRGPGVAALERARPHAARPRQRLVSAPRVLAGRAQVGDRAARRLERAAGDVVARQAAQPADSLAQQLLLAPLRRRTGFPGEVRGLDHARVVERQVLSQASLQRAVPGRVRHVDAFLAVPEGKDTLHVGDFPDTLGREAPAKARDPHAPV